MRSLISILLTGLFSSTALAQAVSEDWRQADYYQKINNYISGSIEYLEKTQFKQTDSIFRLSGEWETNMGMVSWFPLMGKVKRTHDSNCFSVATIHNILADVYLQYPEYDQIPPILDLAYERVLTYENEGSFNFWNLLPPTRRLKLFGKNKGKLSRRPNNYELKLRFIQKAANVANDADDTALGFKAIYLNHQTRNLNVSDSLAGKVEIFNEYRDVNRRNRMWYNLWQRQGPKSGAYLTWFGDEYQFRLMWNPIGEFFHFATFFLPVSKMYPRAYQSYIPYGSNDLDPVVNLNVISTLSMYGKEDSEAVQKAIQFVEFNVLNRKFDFAATYYPNRYQLPYHVSKTHAQGVAGLEKSCEFVRAYILNNQHAAGYWLSRSAINASDTLQSTIYAISSLLNIDGIDNETSWPVIQKGLAYVFSQIKNEEGQLFWEGGVFFSGGTVVRDIMYWKSDAVTTALMLETLVKIRREMEKVNPYLGSSSLTERK